MGGWSWEWFLLGGGHVLQPPNTLAAVALIGAPWPEAP